MNAKGYYEELTGEDKIKAFLNSYEIGNDESKNAPTLEVVHDPEPKDPGAEYIKTNKNDLPKSEPQRMTLKAPWNGEVYNVELWPREAIRLFGNMTNRVNGPVDFDITFKIGDVAEYDSYNLSYTGEIVSIGPKTVTIKHDGYSDRKSRLDLTHFAWRNWDYDAERLAKEAANWYD